MKRLGLIVVLTLLWTTEASMATKIVSGFFDQSATALPQGDFTAMGWFKIFVGVGSNPTIWGLTDDNENFSYINASTIADGGQQKPELELYDGSTSYDLTGVTALTVADAKWYHWVIRRSGTTVTYHLSDEGGATLDVVLQASQAVTLTDAWDSMSLTGGTYSHEHIKIWTAVLTDAEVQIERDRTNVCRTSNLYMHTPLEVHTDLTDISGNSHDWTSFGTEATVTGPAISSLACATALPPIPVTTTRAPITPCLPQAQVDNGGKGQAGCNSGGVGWTSSYTGPYGVVPSYSDPVDGETLSGKSDVDLWVDLVHTDYPTEVVTTYRHSLVDLADAPTYHGGRKVGRLLSLGDVGHGLSNEQGGLSAASVDLGFSDAADRHFRTLLETQDLEGDELRVKLASPEARAAGSAPRILQRAIVQKSPTTSPLKAGITAVDALFADFGPFGPDRTFPSRKIPGGVWLNTPPASLDLVIPVLYGEKSDEGATNPETNVPLSKGLIPLIYVGQEDLSADSPEPPALVEDTSLPAVVPTSVTNAAFQGGDIKVTTYIFTAGVKDGAIGPVTAWAPFDPLGVTEPDGVALAIHLVREELVDSYVAWASDDPTYHPVTNPLVGNVGTGTHDNATRDAFYDDGSDFTLLIRSLNNEGRVTSDVWDAYLVHLGAGFQILNLYGSDLGGGLSTNQRDRTLIDTATRGGSDVLGPDWPNWPFAERYRAYTDPEGTVYWLTMIYVRGPLSDDHKNGVVNLTVNAIGIEETGDGTGLPLIDAHAVQQHWIENFLLNDYTSGLWVTTATNPEWEDGTAKVRSSSFAAAQTFSVSKVGGRGLTVGWYSDNAQDLSTITSEWNASTETRLGINGHGQIMLGWLDELADTTTWPRVDHVPQIFGSITRTPGEERENIVSGQCDWDPDQERFRGATISVTSTAGITKYKNRRKPGEPVLSTILNTDAHLTWVLQRRLWRCQYGSTTVTVPGGLSFLDQDVNNSDGVLLTSIEGPGASGWVDAPMWLLWRQTSINDRLVTYTLLEVTSTLIPLAEQFVVSDGLSDVGLLTSTGFLVGA